MNTALSAEGNEKMFVNDEHIEFYQENIEKCRYQDVYHKALIYCLGISSEVRRKVERIYDFENEEIKPECLKEGWVTGGFAKVIRLAFNLFCNDTPSIYEYEDDLEEAIRECKYYAVEDIFCCEYGSYFFQAIMIRYPEYFRNEKGGF
ncbi:DUF6075 family protein [Ohessyouella blattaphilus]|uniref:DUF6075 family protein n=1 Tax=Ohessyouella blattaphilus TaxID=2949333 RepID=A0ABT1EHU5_9FIRM|nr:DUF6075 family protein [Ohessyouella blattaphilus]MCP1110273.1 DUF6075 family protein [Ohessyouella blattaphilus]MCR8563667.1 DUF6075 family protein [Ohessyouella blattaphilus]